jgi:lipoprotein-anchoring transpeptidase ErfK/SrfK
MRRALTILCLALSMAALPASPAAAQAPVAPVEEPRIRAGVTVSGVDVGNLTLAEAQLALEAALGPALAQDIVVVAAGRRFTFRPSAARFAFRADKTAQRALAAGLAAPAAADGTLPPASAVPSVTYRHAPIWRFAKRVRAGVAIAPRDARLRITLTRLIKRPGRRGRTLAVRPLTRAIERVMADPLAVREVGARTRVVAPAVRTKELKRRYRTVITIDRANFRLRLFKRLKVVKRYGVAVGLPDYPTPTGLFSLQSKQVNPTWTAPNSPWAGEMAGQQVAGGAPDNPLKARWMGVSGAVGIHGTGQPWTIGTRASHGCIRMTVPDVIDLFDRVSVGTPVLIA